MMTCAWMWMYAGAAMMLLELLAPGFVLFFFGLAAASVGLCRFALGEMLSPTWQMVAFSAFSILYLAVLRRWLKGVFAGAKSVSDENFDSDFVGRAGVVTAAIEPPKPGRVMLGDAEWSAESDAPLAEGSEVRVVAQRNLTVRVAPI